VYCSPGGGRAAGQHGVAVAVSVRDRATRFASAGDSQAAAALRIYGESHHGARVVAAPASCSAPLAIRRDRVPRRPLGRPGRRPQRQKYAGLRILR
jgi:hypothetical protein